jgi:8-oxo-dGTP pyrophosphatase MutT (NUDIX family)
MRWTVHGERSIYESDWVSLRLVDVEIPGSDRFEHHVVRMPLQAAGVVACDPERGVLLLWRHRFITDTWGWELPAGRLDPGETPEQAAERECVEEAGWRPGPLRHLVTFAPMSGVCDQQFHVFAAAGATYVGEPTDPGESERVEWVARDALRAEVAAGRVNEGLSLTGVLWLLAFGAD